MDEDLNSDFIEHFSAGIVTICERLKNQNIIFSGNIGTFCFVSYYEVIELLIYTLPGLKAVENYSHNLSTHILTG